MTTTVPDGSRAAPVGPPPPFDPELAAVLAVINEQLPSSVTLDLIAGMRQPDPALPPPTDEELRRGGAFEVTEWLVPGPAGAPEVSLLICRPAHAAMPTAAIYHIHGGGSGGVGDNRFGVPLMMDWAVELDLAVVSVEYRLAPETPHPGRLRTAMPGCRGRRNTPTSWASTRTASSSPAPARVAGWPRRSR